MDTLLCAFTQSIWDIYEFSLCCFKKPTKIAYICLKDRMVEERDTHTEEWKGEKRKESRIADKEKEGFSIFLVQLPIARNR